MALTCRSHRCFLKQKLSAQALQADLELIYSFNSMAYRGRCLFIYSSSCRTFSITLFSVTMSRSIMATVDESCIIVCFISLRSLPDESLACFHQSIPLKTSNAIQA